MVFSKIENVFSQYVKKSLGVALAMLVLLGAAESRAAQPANGNQHSRTVLRDLNQDQQLQLNRSLRASLVRTDPVRDGDESLSYLTYQRVFLRMLMDPSLMVGLDREDRELIDNLPAHNNPRFLRPVSNSMAAACRVIEALSPRNPRAAGIAARSFSQARDRMRDLLNRHYQQVLTRVSPAARELIEIELSRPVAGSTLVHTEIDFDALSFSEPEFALAFLRDACANSVVALQSDPSQPSTLKAQLTNDLKNDGVNVYLPN